MLFENILFDQRKIARKSKRTITIKDFGAGSKKLGNQRSISKIYSTSVATQKWQRLLFHLVHDFKSEKVLEMGTSLGFSSIYLSEASSGKITTVEACQETYSEANKLFKIMGTPNITSINATFKEYFEQTKDTHYDFVYIDGHHDGTALLEYIETLKPRMIDKTVVIVDDIRWSDGMNSAWIKLLNDQSFTANVDLFRMGILQYKKNSN